MTTEFSREVEWARRFMIKIGKELKRERFVFERMNSHPGCDLRRGFQLKTKTSPSGNYLFFSTLNRMVTASLCHRDEDFVGPDGCLILAICFLDEQLKEAVKGQSSLIRDLAKGVTSQNISADYDQYVQQIIGAFKWYEARWKRFFEQRTLVEKEMKETLLSFLQ